MKSVNHQYQQLDSTGAYAKPKRRPHPPHNNPSPAPAPSPTPASGAYTGNSPNNLDLIG